MMHGTRYTDDDPADDTEEVEDYNSDYYENQPGDAISSATNHRRTYRKNWKALALLTVGTFVVIGGIGYATRNSGGGSNGEKRTKNAVDLSPTRPPSFLASPAKSPTLPQNSPAPTQSSLERFVASLVGDKSLQDENSTASQALSFLKKTYDPQRFDNSRLQQRFALACIYLGTISATSAWNQKDGWLTSQNECEWYGVTCKNQKVVSLNLTSNGLDGTIPSEITLLGDRLVALELRDNYLSNEGQELAWMGELTNLRKYSSKGTSSENI